VEVSGSVTIAHSAFSESDCDDLPNHPLEDCDQRTNDIKFLPRQAPVYVRSITSDVKFNCKRSIRSRGPFHQLESY